MECDRQREELLRVVTHDLRSHLSCILLSGQLVLDDCRRGGLDDAAGRAGHLVHAALQIEALLAELIESVELACSPVELHLQTVRLDELFAAALRRAADAAEAEGRDPVHVVVRAEGALPAVRGDAARLERALGCLVHHARGRTTNGHVGVTFAHAHGELRITVRDHGPDIPDGELARVFGRFYRPEQAAVRNGIGVELFIARMLVEAHGGRVWVRSGASRGATYGVALPAVEAGPVTPF